MNYMQYPSYEEIEEWALTRCPERASKMIEFWAEYGTVNHERMKRIFVAMQVFPHDDERCVSKVREIGEQIHRMGGLRAMQGCYYVLAAVVSLMWEKAQKTEKLRGDLQSIRYNLSWFWNGVGDWEH